jgi:hypothetical protein
MIDTDKKPIELAEFHDAALAHATRKLNGIISGLINGNRDRSRKLSFVHHKNRLLLVWASYGRIGPHDDFKTIRKTLKLKK